MKEILKKVMCVIAMSILMVTSIPNISQGLELQPKSSKGEYLIINSKTNKMAYYKNGKLVKEFRVATGKKSTPTPTGKFKIVNKIKNRPYYSGGIPGGSPNNPLGDRWIGLRVGATNGTTYAVHGNNDESSIGKHISGGCIRMHNKDVRWLFDDIGIGGYAIIDYSDKSFIEIASKHGVNLQPEKSQNVINTINEFNKFVNYKNFIDLRKSNDLITSTEDASNMLASKENYLKAYNKLTSTEKNITEIKNIHAEFNKIVKILEFANASLSFYENITTNAHYIKNDIDWVRRLINPDSDELGTKGKALKMYNEAVGTGETKDNSKRIAYLDLAYTDSSFFLYSLECIADKNFDMAKEYANKIQDINLRTICEDEINIANYSDISGHWAEQDILGAMNNGWVENSNIFRPNDSITRAEFIKIINRAFNFTDKTEITFTDVSTDDWYYNDVCIAVNSGYIDGNDDNTFKPNENITREEVAKIVTSIMNNKDEDLDKISNYIDFDAVSEWARPFVEGAVENEYMGKDSIEFRPKDNITRAESIVTIKRVAK